MKKRSGFQTTSSFFIDTFSGRESELYQLHQYLKSSSRYPVILTGPPGIGKTALAYMYAEKFATEYKTIQKFSSASSKDIESLIDNISDSISRNYNAISNKEHLVIIDDFDVSDHRSQIMAYDFLIKIADKVSVLIVTRTSALHYYRNDSLKFNQLELRPLSHSELMDVITKSFAWSNSSESDEFFKNIKDIAIDQVSPRFAKELISAFIKINNFDAAYKEVANGYFPEISELVITSDKDKLRVVPISGIDCFSVKSFDGKIITGTSSLLIPNVRKLWKSKIEEFEEMINDPRIKEQELQNFFERNPKLLCGLDYHKLIPHPVLERDDDGDLIPDFFLAPVAKNFADVLDLKKPGMNLFAGRKDRERLSQSACDVLAQLRVYRDYFDNPTHTNRVKDKYGITAYKPNVIAVIGRNQFGVSEEKQRQIMDDLPRYAEIITYDDLLAKMRQISTLNLY